MTHFHNYNLNIRINIEIYVLNKQNLLFITTLLIFYFFSHSLKAETIKRTSKKFSEKTVSLQLDGYKHLAYKNIFSKYTYNLLKEFSLKTKNKKVLKEIQKEINELKRSDLTGNNPFHIIEDLIIFYEKKISIPIKKSKGYRNLQNNHWDNLDLSNIQKCEFNENTIAQTQVCYHYFPSKEERDTNKLDLILLSIGGRRTGMTKILPLGKIVHKTLKEHFNLFSLTVEAKMFARDEKYIHHRIANTLKAVVDSVKKINFQKKPRIVLSGYSYGGSHLINSINQIFTRSTFKNYVPDLLLFVDPDGALNTLKHLHLVPIAKRIVNFRGIYIVPQPKLRFVKKLITSTLDKYPSLEGTQPLVLLKKANFEEIVVYQENNLDLSPHNRVPYDIVEYRDKKGHAVYLDKIRSELINLRANEIK